MGIEYGDGSSSDAGRIVQIVQTVKTDSFSSTTANSFFDITGMSVSITPKSSSNKVLVLVNLEVSMPSELSIYRLLRGSTVINVSTVGSLLNGFGMCDGEAYQQESRSTEDVTCTFLDSPNTTSSTTYKIQCEKNGGGTMQVNRRRLNSGVGFTSQITCMEVAA